MKRKFTLLLAIYCCSFGLVSGQTISTIVGTGTAGYSGDGGPAISAQIDHPFGVATDTAGNIYITDRNNNRIRKVAVTGTITTVAGTGIGGYNGDGMAATLAQINNITGVAVDHLGNIYIADKSNNRIRKVDAGGIITTIAGDGTASFGGDGAAATVAQLNNPRGVAVDHMGNIYIADQGNNRIRFVSASGLISTIAGTTTAGYNGDNIAATAAQLNGPYNVVVDAAGNVFIADVDNYRIRCVDGSGMISTVAGNGTQGFSGDGNSATAAQLNEAIGIALDSSGNLFIADGWNRRIRCMNKSGTIETIAGTGVAGYNGDGINALSAQLNNPYGVALGKTGELYIADYDNNKIRKITHPLAVIEPVDLSTQLSTFPNPSSGELNIIYTGKHFDHAQVVLYAVTGEVAGTYKMPLNQLTINTRGFSPGIYFCAITIDDNSVTRTVLFSN